MERPLLSERAEGSAIQLPEDPWSLLPAAGDPVRTLRELEAFGLRYELAWIPGRGARADRPGEDRLAFGAARGECVRAEEALWSDGELVLTPNRWPFFARQFCVWPAGGHAREASEGFLARALALLERSGGSLLVNTLGASASIALAHAHLVAAEGGALAGLPLAELAEGEGWRVLATDPDAGCPLFAACVEADEPALRARLLRALLDARLCASANCVAQRGRAWLLPRRVETPAPHFPWALGAAELWGRFVYPDEASFAAARAEDLEAALAAACTPPSAEQSRGLARALADRAG